MSRVEETGVVDYGPATIIRVSGPHYSWRLDYRKVEQVERLYSAIRRTTMTDTKMVPLTFVVIGRLR